MRTIPLLIGATLIISSCSNPKTDTVQEGAASDSVAIQPSPDTAGNEGEQPSKEENSTKSPEPDESWPAPEPSPEPPELKSDYWPAPADGYFPVPTYMGKAIPFNKFHCTESGEWLKCDLDTSVPAVNAVDAYDALLKKNEFFEEGGYFFKKFSWNTVRVARAIAAYPEEEGRENEKPHLQIMLGRSYDREGYYTNILDKRIPYPIAHLGIKTDKTLEIESVPEKIMTYIYERKIITEKDEIAYEKAGFSKEAIDNMKNYFIKDLIPNYEKRLQLAGFKKDTNYPVYVRKLEDGSFLSVAIEPECYIWNLNDKFERKNKQMCINMTKGRIKPVDPDDVAGFYHGLPDSTIPYPRDIYYHKAYKYISRVDDGNIITFNYKNFPKSMDYIQELKSANFIEASNEEITEGNRQIHKLELKKDMANGQKVTVEVSFESQTDSAYAKSVYNNVTIRMSKGES